MRASISVAEMGLGMIFLARATTRLYQRRAIALYGIAGARAAQVPGSGVIPAWVSLLTLAGWFIALVAAGWILFT